MDLFRIFKRKQALKRHQEEALYKFVSEEMKSGIIREGLMAKALAENSGSEKKSRGAY